MDVISLGKATKALQDITDLSTNIVPTNSESRFPTVDARLDWIEGQASSLHVDRTKPVNLSLGTFTNTELVGGKVQLKLISAGNYETSGTYETSVVDLGDMFNKIKAIDVMKTINVGSTDVVVQYSSSIDGITFGSYQTIDPANFVHKRYIKILASFNGDTISTPILESVTIQFDELTIEGRLKELERLNLVNMAKLQFKANALMASAKYNLHDMVIDTFEGDTMTESGSTAYRTSTKDYAGVGSITTDAETLPSLRRSLIISADHVNCTFEYSLDGGTTWYNTSIDNVIDITIKTGNSLKVKVSLPDPTATITALSYAWA